MRGRLSSLPLQVWRSWFKELRGKARSHSRAIERRQAVDWITGVLNHARLIHSATLRRIRVKRAMMPAASAKPFDGAYTIRGAKSVTLFSVTAKSSRQASLCSVPGVTGPNYGKTPTFCRGLVAWSVYTIAINCMRRSTKAGSLATTGHSSTVRFCCNSPNANAMHVASPQRLQFD